MGLDGMPDASGLPDADSDFESDPPTALGAVRRVCKDARAAFDRGCPLPLAFGPLPGPPKDGDPSPAEAVKWALDMLHRGRRPKEVRIWVDKDNGREAWSQGGLDLLRALPSLSGRPTDAVSRLTLPAKLLSRPVAALLLGAFPCLTRLVLQDAGSLGAEAVEGLRQLLLGSRRGAGSGCGGGLTELGMTGVHGLPDGTASILAAAKHVRSLDLPDAKFPDESDEFMDFRRVNELASVSHLCALRIGHCDPTLLPFLIDVLTRLTSLELKQQVDVDPLPAHVFGALKGLQRLHAPNLVLYVEQLAEELSALTHLNVNALTCHGFEDDEPLTSVPRWALPPGLRRLGLSTAPLSYAPQSLEVLAGLEPPAGMELDPGSVISLQIVPGRHATNEDDYEARGDRPHRLRPAAEEALCGAVGFMQRHRLHVGGELCVEYETPALTSALVEGISLSCNDIRTIRDSLTTLESLTLQTPTDLPLPAIPLLAGLPRLSSLGLDATAWAYGGRHTTEDRGKATAAIVGLALALHEGPAQQAGGERPRQLDLNLLYGQGRTTHQQWCVRGTGQEITFELEKAGVVGLRVLVEGRDVAEEDEQADGEGSAGGVDDSEGSEDED
ncbi:hypothetical protein HYH03_001167 [Edaphochlamys debaryana]|uniref:Uncharacterized protein n=1 Tax=Edaphochlamys debaryana TaxID=47281 RepID=A0A835YPB4_9CHLO|nr:hypothetical protein HYH03_001167 [Edaphochlamys debaryana]|eukprot:KAG2501379.1 hypothetical protein HYH03_001167 [Edaphochlamys debaryana]